MSGAPTCLVVENLLAPGGPSRSTGAAVDYGPEDTCAESVPPVTYVSPSQVAECSP
jgi:hypothetical protein